MNAEVSVWLDSPAALITSAVSTKFRLVARFKNVLPEEIIGAFTCIAELESKVANDSVVTDSFKSRSGLKVLFNN